METILAFKAINLTKTKKYTSEQDPEYGTDKASVFTIGAIDSRTMSHIIDSNMESKIGPDGEQMSKYNQLTVAYNLVRFGLKDITNFENDDGTPLVFKTEKINYGGKTYTVAADEILSVLPTFLIMELAAEVNEVNTVSETDSKN